jgi:uncharacterized protein
MNPVVHFEMPYEDRERAAKFYQETFGWKMQMLGPEMGNYVLAQTDEMDEKGMLKETNRINGGMYERSKDNQYPSVVIAVEDIRAHKKKVEEAGGKFLGGQGAEFDDIPGIGLYASFLDPEGNRVGMLQPNPGM